MANKKYILHVDANSAYLSWISAWRLDMGYKVDLREIPCVIGGREEARHGIVLAKSIPAKQYGIQTGESLFAARQKCPNLSTVPANYALFMKASNAMVEIIKSYSPKVQRFSVDECFLELSLGDKDPDPVTLAYELKDQIYKQLGFTVNVGVSINKILAKMGGELEKPNKVHTLWPEEVPRKLWPLPVGELFMVGRKTEEKLLKRGIATIGQLANADVKTLEKEFKSFAYVIYSYANGWDDSLVRPGDKPVIKSIGNGTTALKDVVLMKDAQQYILSLSESVGSRLRLSGYYAGLVEVAYTTREFTGKSRQRKLNIAMNSTTFISQIACELFEELWDGTPLRKLKVKVSDLHVYDYIQLSMLEVFDFEKHKALDLAVDNIRQRYGKNFVQRGSLLRSDPGGMAGGVEEDDYPFMTSIL